MENDVKQAQPTTDPFNPDVDLEKKLRDLEVDGYRTVFVKKVGLMPVQLETDRSNPASGNDDAYADSG